MSKKFLTWTLILAFATCHSPAFITADSVQDPIETTQEVSPLASQPEQSVDAAVPSSEEVDDEETPKGTPVNPTNPTESKKTNRQFWTNILIAGVAVVVAVVSILIVSNNNGTKK
ncbi:MAG: hypothetical protein JSS09_06440 [Verrucomicrobia bacterium]|nr:hypothetical protein [Verrucomicrobiota bacterium]